MVRCCAAAFFVLTCAGVACSDGYSNASTDYCELAASATRGEVNFADESQYSLLVQNPSLPARHRSAMTSAVEQAKLRTADGHGWSNDDMVKVVNVMCDLKLTPVTMVP